MIFRSCVVAVLMAGVSGCASQSPPSTYAANTPISPGQVVGSESDAYDTPPRLISGRAPIYPVTHVLKAGGGQSTIEFTIAADGTTRDFLVVHSDHEYFANHSIIAVRQWRFEPAMKDGRPIDARVRKTFNYAIK